jgi:hypothetical protein
MLKHIADQSERLTGGLVGAMMGVIFSMASPLSIGSAVAFLATFFVLFCTQGLPRFFAQQRTHPNALRYSILIFLLFLISWLLAVIHFGNFYVFSANWTVNSIDLRVLLLLLTLLGASVVSLISAIVEGFE